MEGCQGLRWGEGRCRAGHTLQRWDFSPREGLRWGWAQQDLQSGSKVLAVILQIKESPEA